jgi:hypothetical protein
VNARRLLVLIALVSAAEALGAPRALINPAREIMQARSDLPIWTIGAASLGAFVLVLLFVPFVDRAPLAGTRRRGWLVLASALLALFWWAFDPAGGLAWAIFSLAAGGVLFSLLRIAGGGLAADTGHRFAATSAVSGARMLGASGAMLAATLTESQVAAFPLTTATRVLAGVFAGLALASLVLADEEPTTRASLPPRSRWFRSRGYWAGILFLCWAEGLGAVSEMMVATREAREAAASGPAWLHAAVLVVASCAYLVLARSRAGASLTSRRLPTLCLGAGLAATVLVALSPLLTPPLAATARGASIGIAQLPMVDLALRYVDRRNAALSFWLQLAIPLWLVSAPLRPLLLLLLDRWPAGATLAPALVSLGLVLFGAAAWRLARKAAPPLGLNV